MSRKTFNFNTGSMKTAFFDDVYDESVPVDKACHGKILGAIDYSINRADSRNVDVLVYFIFDADVAITKEQRQTLITCLTDKKFEVFVAFGDLITGKTSEGNKITYRFIGGFDTFKVSGFADTDSSGSEFENYNGQGLTQECFMAKLDDDLPDLAN